ncbi:ribosomal-protein-alanine N-acetyltransferase [Variovorax boronicumulans]|uniref:Ribosomal-protein-alanine N-acetyltransferase n=1 Tax=Variovorax boronicumulans TaxID=436515 RepID=A0AAW8E4T2_9BURK|nr:GNAT family protein [Variovorax boronicumulans]MDP9881581.1 ribosomal-protein-alanine N-acetyltransferase [Variovorax boronicumulans]MDP9926868.1 ribosomal-protein-alanine N-acetyltransferase [Variovorax boronicumulans]
MTDFPKIETQRLVLREVTTEDATALLSIHGDPDLMKWFGSDPLPDQQAAEKLVATFVDWQRTGTGTRWGVQLKGHPSLIGTCGLFRWDQRWKRCTTGYELAQNFHGQGLMREALTAMLHWGFREMNLNRVEAQIHPQNTPSLKLADALGFQREGLLREAGYWGGRHHDLLQYALLLRDYVAT